MEDNSNKNDKQGIKSTCVAWDNLALHWKNQVARSAMVKLGLAWVGLGWVGLAWHK